MINLITEHIDIWTAAQTRKKNGGRGRGKNSNGQSSYGINKLRELILELAVRGKLVPQDPNDEPASVLLEKIAKEKTQLIKENKIKQQKKLPEIGEDEKTFESPEGWQWARLSDCYDVRDGTHDSPKAQKKGFPLVTSKNISSGVLNLDNVNYISKEDHQKILIRSKVDRNDILFAMIGSIGNPVIVDTDEEFSIKNVALFKYYVAELSSPKYLKLFLELASNDMKKNAAGGVQSFVSLGKLRSYVMPVPPLAEQHRIDAKVDELMALCDQLEQQQTDSIDTHQTLVETLLAALTSVADQGEFAKTWLQITDHFDTLFTTEQSIDQLKQTILQLAVKGKLVPQDPNDEPASVLLEKITKEKARLIKEGKIKKQKPLVNFQGLNELKGQIPGHWTWIRLTDIADIVRGGSPRPAGDPRYYNGEIPFLKVADVTRTKGKMIEEFNFTIKEAGLKKTRFINQRTVLLTNSGATLGIPAICDFDATFNDGIAAFVELTEFVFDEYLHLYLKSLSKWFIEIASRGQGQPNLNTDIIKATWFALPPFEEQYRIVAKVDELMALCEDLKVRLIDAQGTQFLLADAIVEQAVA